MGCHRAMQKAISGSNQIAGHPFNVEGAEITRGMPCATAESSEPAAGGLRAARIASVIAEINEGFADQRFSTCVLAERLGLSVRYVQDLLQDSGSGITDRIMDLRLAKARRLLIDDHSRLLKIGDVAKLCGFSELSYFHRSFRRRFGASPAKFRAKSLRS